MKAPTMWELVSITLDACTCSPLFIPATYTCPPLSESSTNSMHTDTVYCTPPHPRLSTAVLIQCIPFHVIMIMTPPPPWPAARRTTPINYGRYTEKIYFSVQAAKLMRHASPSTSGICVSPCPRHARVPLGLTVRQTSTRTCLDASA